MWSFTLKVKVEMDSKLPVAWCYLSRLERLSFKARSGQNMKLKSRWMGPQSGSRPRWLRWTENLTLLPSCKVELAFQHPLVVGCKSSHHMLEPLHDVMVVQFPTSACMCERKWCHRLRLSPADGTLINQGRYYLNRVYVCVFVCGTCQLMQIGWFISQTPPCWS